MVRPRTPLLSRERIVEVAVTVIDAEGLDALSTRRLARELGVQAPSLYNHFSTKEDILDAVGDEIVARVDLSMLGRDAWPEALSAWARIRTQVSRPSPSPTRANSSTATPAAAAEKSALATSNG